MASSRNFMKWKYSLWKYIMMPFRICCAIIAKISQILSLEMPKVRSKVFNRRKGVENRMSKIRIYRLRKPKWMGSIILSLMAWRSIVLKRKRRLWRFCIMAFISGKCMKPSRILKVPGVMRFFKFDFTRDKAKKCSKCKASSLVAAAMPNQIWR